jgi:hypothetical protein
VYRKIKSLKIYKMLQYYSKRRNQWKLVEIAEWYSVQGVKISTMLLIITFVIQPICWTKEALNASISSSIIPNWTQLFVGYLNLENYILKSNHELYLILKTRYGLDRYLIWICWLTVHFTFTWFLAVMVESETTLKETLMKIINSSRVLVLVCPCCDCSEY